MRRRMLCLILVALIASAAFAGIPGNFFNITVGSKAGKVKHLVVDQGGLALGDPSPYLTLRKEATSYPDRWVVMGGKIKASVGGKYLAYDASGKHNRIFLSATPDGEGTEWVIHRAKWGTRPKNGRGGNGEEWGVLQAASGPMKGWYIDVEEFEEKREDGQKVLLHRFILSKEPAWNTEVARMYLHL